MKRLILTIALSLLTVSAASAELYTLGLILKRNSTNQVRVEISPPGWVKEKKASYSIEETSKFLRKLDYRVFVGIAVIGSKGAAKPELVEYFPLLKSIAENKKLSLRIVEVRDGSSYTDYVKKQIEQDARGKRN